VSGGRREAAAEPALQAAPPDTDGAPLCLSVSVACPNQCVGVMTKFCTQPPSRPASGPVARSVFSCLSSVSCLSWLPCVR